MSTDDKRKTLETYFAEHRIQETLNDMLNKMVCSRPTQPYSWLARQMRQADGPPPVGTVPLLDKSAGASAFGDLEKTWGYVLGLQGLAPAGAPAGAPPAKPTAPKGIELSIDAVGERVLLAIREK